MYSGDDIGKFNENFERYKERITNFSNEFEFGLFLYIFRRTIPIIVSLISISAIAAYFYLAYSEPIFEARTILHLVK